MPYDDVGVVYSELYESMQPDKNSFSMQKPIDLENAIASYGICVSSVDKFRNKHATMATKILFDDVFEEVKKDLDSLATAFSLHARWFMLSQGDKSLYGKVSSMDRLKDLQEHHLEALILGLGDHVGFGDISRVRKLHLFSEEITRYLSAISTRDTFDQRILLISDLHKMDISDINTLNSNSEIMNNYIKGTVPKEHWNVYGL